MFRYLRYFANFKSFNCQVNVFGLRDLSEKDQITN